MDDIDENNHNFLECPQKNEMGSQIFLANLIKSSLLLGVEKLLIARKAEPLAFSDFEPQNDNEPNSPSKNTKSKGKYASKMPSTYSSSSENYNFLAFFTVIVLKLFGYQISLFLRFFTFPIWCFNFWLMFFMFPFQTLTGIKAQIKKKLITAFNFCFLKLISFICDKFKSPKAVLKLVIRVGRGFFCAAYVFLVLIGLLILGFFIGGFVMRNLIEESIHKTEILNFDYTQTSPSAVVPIISSAASRESLSRRAVPYNHKLQLIVSLTLPESEYNRKLGVFQVRVETLSSTGKMILGSSYPTMLRFKSQPVRIIQTLFNSIPLITGLKSEVQNIKIVIGEFVEGYEPTSSFKVIIEQRAASKASSGVSEIYGASLEIASEMPRLRRVMWSWRRTMFVWIGFVLFMVEMMVLLIFCRHVLLLGGRLKK